MYIGTTSQMGLNVLVREIWDNSIDEYTAGFGDTIDIEIFKNGRVKVIDHGRGIPVGPHPEWKKPDGTPLDTLTGILTILHAGGKFGEEGSAYKSAAGLHGVGSKCANALSKEFIATVKRDGKIYQQKFKYGDPVTDVEVIGSCDINDTGTTIEYEPDPNIFKQTVLPNCNALQNKIDEVTSLNGGLTIKYKNNNTNVEKVFHHPDGINSYVKTIIGEKKKLFEEPFYYSEMVKVDNKCINVEFSFIYDDEDKPAEVFKTFANNVNTTEGGYHLVGFRDSYKKCMNDFIIKNNLSKTDVELRYLLDGIYCIISVRVPEAEFEGQTKNKLGNIEAKAAVIIAVEKMFEKLSDSRSEDIKLIADRAIKVKIAEEAARKARQNARAANKASKMALPGKLIDCSNKTGYRELFLVEGDSAGGCHTYDTKVKLADGRDLEIGKIVEEFNQGKTNYVYSCDKNGKIFVQPITDAFITKRNTQVIRLTLDNGEQIKCTPEHPYMLRDGSYKEAQYLTKEDSLMPLYFNRSNHPFFNNFDIPSNEQTYEFIKMNNDNKWYATHRIVAEQYYGIKPNNMLNNNIDNIVNEARTHNHKVIKIEWLEQKEDVYDITVPPYSNFALSAGIFVHNSAKMGRFHKFQAILPLRGKVLNVEKVDISRVLNSDSIKGIISAIGTGVGTNFNIKKARYDKILIMSDADVDGSHIRILLLTFFYNYMRPLIEAGMVYSTQPPLFKVILKDKSFIYLKDDEALAIYKKKNGKKIDDIQRFKGLGEMDPPELRETVLSLENRTVKQITIQDAKEASETFKLFMSKDVAPRRQFIEEHAHLVDLTLL